MNKNQANDQAEQTGDQAKENMGRASGHGIGSRHSEEKRKLQRAIAKAELDFDSLDSDPNNNL